MPTVQITDVTLRDGSHPMGHAFTREQVEATARALEAGGVRSIEIGHGDGIGGSSFNYGFSELDEFDLIAAAVDSVEEAEIGIILLPGIGTADLIRRAADLGVKRLRVATHSTEADVGIEHIHTGRELGLTTTGFLMLSHMTPPDEIVRQGQIMVDAGATCVYVADSAGAMLPDDATARVAALREALPAEVEIGFHGHNNLSLGVACSMASVGVGATWIDGALAALGAGAGNSATEVIAAVFERAGIETELEPIPLLQAAENVVRPYMKHEPRIDFDSVVLGYGGVYSSFLLHGRRAAERYDVPMHEVLLEAGRRQLVGGQEDVLIEIAVELAKEPAGAPAG